MVRLGKTYRMASVPAIVLVALATALLNGCKDKSALMDFDAEVCYWLCKRDNHEFTCTFDELGEFQTTGGHAGQTYLCPICKKNDAVVRLPDTTEVIERFKKIK